MKADSLRAYSTQLGREVACKHARLWFYLAERTAGGGQLVTTLGALAADCRMSRVAVQRFLVKAEEYGALSLRIDPTARTICITIQHG